MKKRMFAVLMTAALTLGLATPAFATGVKRPVLISVAVGEGVLNEDEAEYEYPVTVVAEGSDAELEHITVRFENEANDNTANLVLRAADQTAENTYEGVLSVSAYAQEGTYTLSKVTLQETDGDYRYYYRSKDLPSDPGDDKKALPNAVSPQAEQRRERGGQDGSGAGRLRRHENERSEGDRGGASRAGHRDRLWDRFGEGPLRRRQRTRHLRDSDLSRGRICGLSLPLSAEIRGHLRPSAAHNEGQGGEPERCNGSRGCPVHGHRRAGRSHTHHRRERGASQLTRSPPSHMNFY